MSNRPCDKNKKDKVLGKINLLQFVLHTTAPPALQMCSDRLGDIFVLPWASPSAVDVLAFHRGLGLSRNAISCVSEAHSSKSPHPHHRHHYHHPSPTPHKNKKEKKRKTPTTTEVFFLRDKTKLTRTHPHIPECIAAAAYPSESRSHMLPRWEGVFCLRKWAAVSLTALWAQPWESCEGEALTSTREPPPPLHPPCLFLALHCQMV